MLKNPTTSVSQTQKSIDSLKYLKNKKTVWHSLKKNCKKTHAETYGLSERPFDGTILSRAVYKYDFYGRVTRRNPLSGFLLIYRVSNPYYSTFQSFWLFLFISLYRTLMFTMN